MLSSLSIENVAVIKRVQIEFTDGFTVLSGQTGAGKSIILDSINLLLGAKADKELIRNGEPRAVVSGLFTNLSDKTLNALRETGYTPDDDNTLLIQRTVERDGKSHIKINGRTANLALLKNIGGSLVAIHGQSDTNSLVDPAGHIDIIDLYAGNADVLQKYRAAYTVYEDILRSINELEAKRREGERLKEILEYQIKDIDALKLHTGEEEELVDKKVKIKNSEKIVKNSEFVYKALKGSEKGGAAYLIDRSAAALSQLEGIVEGYGDYSSRLKDILSSLEDIAEEVYAVIEDMDGDPTATLNEIEARLDKISKIKRKYGYTIEEVLNFRDKAAEELSAIENSEDIIKDLRKREESAYGEALAVAEELHLRRIKAAKELDAGVKETLEFLDMPKVVFFSSITPREREGKKLLGPLGYDEAEFYISANLGADAQSLSKIASGGELARVMLGLKSVIADKDGISTVIFDEIDAGVSGKTARKIGIKMLSLSKKTQLICVTHSAQIASLSDMHFLISKSVVNSQTEAAVTLLDYDGRVDELSRILGGISVTEAQREAAVDMLKEKSGFIE